MTMSAAHYDKTFPPFENGTAIKDALTYVSGAGTPTVTSTVPTRVGQFYLDTSAAQFWMAVTVSSPAVVGDFKQITTG
jgi:hypothetical protein